jgi:hypothetical protein
MISINNPVALAFHSPSVLCLHILATRMPIPRLEPTGFLPVGIHNCTLAEIRERFGVFQRTDRRLQLIAKLEEFIAEAKKSGILCSLVVNGSFVTSEPAPNDIDLIAVVSAEHDFSAELSPAQYNLLSKHRVRRRFGFDLLVARENSLEYDRWTEFFQQVRLEPGQQKGILNLAL